MLILNVLTIPVRILVGMLVDKFGPRIMYATLLALCGALCFFFAFATSYEMLAMARLLLGCVGAGFVIGINAISEWFPARQVGWRKVFTVAGATSGRRRRRHFPAVGRAGFRRPECLARWAVATTGVIALVYSVIFYVLASDTPKGSTYFKPKKLGAMEVTSRGDLALYIMMQIPMMAALAVLTWKLSRLA